MKRPKTMLAVGMRTEERRQTIVRLVRERGRVDVTELVGRLDVTAETVLGDLAVLEERGVLSRVPGGAVPAGAPGTIPTAPRLPPERDMTMAAEKERIAKAAIAEVPTEGAILLDAGSTVAWLADVLPVDRELTVVTHSVSMALTLSGWPNLNLMLIGGRIRANSLVAVDSWALEALENTYVDVAFLSASGVSVDRGLTEPDAAEAMVKRAAIVSARRTVLLADHTKIGRDHLSRFGDLSDVDTFITDDGVDPRCAREIAAAGSRLLAV